MKQVIGKKLYLTIVNNLFKNKVYTKIIITGLKNNYLCLFHLTQKSSWNVKNWPLNTS
jgi:hypothetical protein